MSNNLIELQNVCAILGRTQVLDHVNLQLREGEILGLWGDNGSGKSALVSLLAGVHALSQGQILLDGKAYCPSSPSDAQRRGVQTIFQQPALLPNLSVAENLCIGAWPFRHGRFLHVDWKAIYAQAEESFRELGCRIDVHAAAQELNLAQQRLVELVKVSRSDARVLIVDELDSVLTVQELAPVFRVLRSLRARGMSVLYISHRIESLAELCDRVCIISEGQIKDTLDAGDPDSRGRLIERLCRAPESQRHPRIYQPAGRVVLQAEGLSTAHGLRGASLQLRKGEVLGIAGFLGSGRSALARALFGIDPLLTGSITLNQAKFSLRSPNDAVRHGIGYISDASADELLCKNLPIAQNITMANIRGIQGPYHLDLRLEQEVCRAFREKLVIQTAEDDEQVQHLSRGNQQKVLLSKWIFTSCQILMIDEPCRNIDQCGKVEIYNIINKLVLEGKSVILISSNFEELLGMSDRILVMQEGTIVRRLERSAFSINAIIDALSAPAARKPI